MNNNKRGSWHMGGERNYRNNCLRGKPHWPRNNHPGPSTNPPESNEIQRLNDSLKETIVGPYKGWKFYFTEEDFIDGSPTHRKILSFENYIMRNRDIFSYEKIQENKMFSLDLRFLLKDAEFLAEWNNFHNDLSLNAEQSLNCISLAMHQTLAREQENYIKCLESEEDISHIEIPLINVRILNHEPIIQLKNLKVHFYGKLVSVRGTVIRVSNVKLICRWMAFRCICCAGNQIVRQPEGVYTTPKSCKTNGCRSQSKFISLMSSSLTRTDNWQLLKLQEVVGTEHCEGGRVPRTVECELSSELVNVCTPGDDVTITGIIRVRNTEEGSGKAKQASVFLLYMDAVSVVNNKNQSQASNGASGIEFNLTDYYAIQKIHAEPLLFKLLVHSLCPTIYGHEVVKAGLLLALFGGTVRSQCSTRADIHVLMVGDPGLGKSQMLQSCSNVAPRGVFVCGNTSTNSGLTVTMTRESGGEYSLEAGALVLADQGCCCIDEFDKMSAQHASLLESMEQQSVSIAKAGVICSLPARTSILAAANPIGGHYNKAKTVSENLRIGAALLSRFDLAFILLDKPNEQLDSLLSEHVLALHAGLKRKRSNGWHGSSNASSTTDVNDTNISLKERLKLLQGEELDVIPHPLLRKYIAYARKYVHPRLSSMAAEILKTFYLELRKQHQTADSTPVTTRQLESLVRLTKARAKLELREEATESDAIDVVEIMKYSLVDTFTDKFGSLDFTRSQHGSGMSERSKAKEFVNILQKKAKLETRSLFNVNELKEIAQTGNITRFYDLLNSLNIQGYLLKKSSVQYQLLSVDF